MRNGSIGGIRPAVNRPQKLTSVVNIYVGNIPFTATEEGLKELFESYGEVVSVSIVLDRETGRSRGFAFVKLGTREAAERAIEELNGREWMGRNLMCNEARGRDSAPLARGGGSGSNAPRGVSGGTRSGSSSSGDDAGRRPPDTVRRFGQGGQKNESDRRGRDDDRSRDRKKKMPPEKERRANNRDWSRYVDDDEDVE